MAFNGGFGVGSDQWLIQYDKCERLVRDVGGMIEERDNEARNGRISAQVLRRKTAFRYLGRLVTEVGSGTRDLKARNAMEMIAFVNKTKVFKTNATIRRQLKQLEMDLTELKQNLIRSVASSQITSMEGERRQTILDNLVSKEAQLESVFSRKTTARFPERSLLGDDFSWSKTSTSNVMEDPDEVLEDFSVEDVRQRQQIVIEQQDQGLEALSSVIARQKQLANAIGDEADLQNEMIDDITDHVDRTRERLIRETRHVQIVSRKSNTCWFWVVIIFLLIAIIVIVAVPYKRN